MHERVAFNRYSVGRATSAAASWSPFEQNGEAVLVQNRHLQLHRLVAVLDPGLSPTTTKDVFFETEPVTFAPRL